MTVFESSLPAEKKSVPDLWIWLGNIGDNLQWIRWNEIIFWKISIFGIVMISRF